jgi:cell wall-associated NlpC family hydrolase
VFSLKKSESSTTEKVLSEGYKLIGTPYVYGAIRLHDGKGNLLKGFSSQKFDCSSLVQYVFYKGANKNLQVTTRTQVKQGKAVAKSDLQRGDCIYFTNEERQYKTGVERVGHVAIYLGDNYILHTASDYARIEKMSQKRWSYYIEARRFV